MKNSTFMLASGRTIRVSALQQHAVYGGLLEGLPTREMNARTIDDMRSQARERTEHEPFVIEPVQRPIDYDGRYPFGEPAALPAIGCVADLVSRGSDPLHFTHLTVIWFQDDYAFPLGKDAEAALLALDWETLAIEEEI
jgi:hypothetical protein